MNLVVKIIVCLLSILVSIIAISIGLDFFDSYKYENIQSFLTDFISAEAITLQIITGILFVFGVWFSIVRINQQEKLIKLQIDNFNEIKKSNAINKYKNHVEHYRQNINYIEGGYISDVNIFDRSLLSYHRVYHNFKAGDFEVSKSFLSLLDYKIANFISLINGKKYEEEIRNELEVRFVEICESAGSIISVVGIGISSNNRIISVDDGDVFPYEVYSYVSKCFEVLVTLLDGELGNWSELAITLANLDYGETEDERRNKADEYEPSDLYLLADVVSQLTIHCN